MNFLIILVFYNCNESSVLDRNFIIELKCAQATHKIVGLSGSFGV